MGMFDALINPTGPSPTFGALTGSAAAPVTVPALRKTTASNGVGYTESETEIAGGPFQARWYRTADRTINEAEAPGGRTVIDTRQRLAFSNKYTPVAVNDVAPVPTNIQLTALSGPIAAGSGESVAVADTSGLIAGSYVYIGNNNAMEAVKVLTIVDATHFTANVTTPHAAGEVVVKADRARIARIRGPYPTGIQCDLEVGAI